MPGLFDLAAKLDGFAAGTTTWGELDAWIEAVTSSDPLDVTRSPSTEWDTAPDEERLFWRWVYWIEATPSADPERRRVARRFLTCLASTGSAAVTLELLPMVLDQDRLCTIIDRHVHGIITRVSLLSMIAESGYAPHAKLWLEHAGTDALRALCGALERGDYAWVARALERAPA